MRSLYARFVKAELGTTSIEYELIALVVSVGILGAVQLLGSQVRRTFNAVGVEFSKA
jgi:pilus assembly protein Flp/PilA